ncbi:MAG: hypothetical protein JSS32_08500 [Verrucomicrobia bacterium]|nr:hypothetical protein [Verrucomicrobiota bacterium]
MKGFNLEDGFKLKDPTPTHVLEVLNSRESQENRVHEFYTPNGSIDMVEFSSTTPNIDEWLIKFDDLHSHSSPAKWLILSGDGIFNVVTPEGEKISVPVQKGSFLLIPANVTHNFTLSQNRAVIALRIFQDKDGWAAKPPTVEVKQM